MAIIRFSPLEDPVIDPRNEEELVEYALDRIYTASGGTLNSFSPSDPARCLVEGQVFAGSELLFYVNKLPSALAIAFLKIAGIMKREGSAAQATLTFTLSSPLATPFTVPAGYVVTSSGSASLGFTTDVVLIIPAGSINGSVAATAEDTGSIYNVAAYTLSNLSQPLAYLSSCTNTEPAAGGTNAESAEELYSRAFAAIRRRGLVSADDYQEETHQILGEGSVAHAIGSLAADRISTERGVVHVFALNADATELNQTQLNDLQYQLQQKTHVAVKVYASNVDLYPIQIKAIAKLVPGSNPEIVASDVYSAIEEYFTPGQLPLGQTLVLKEVEFLVRQQVGVEYVQSVTLGGVEAESPQSTNLPLPHPYSAALLESLEVELVGESESYTYLYGVGDPD